MVFLDEIIWKLMRNFVSLHLGKYKKFKNRHESNRSR